MKGKNFFKIVLRVISTLSTVGLLVSGVAVLFMIFLITLEVMSRKILGFSTMVADEFSGYLFVVITFMGSAYTFKMGGFTRVEMIYGRFKGKGRRIVSFLIILVALIYLVIIDYWLWVYSTSSYLSGLTSISIVQTPLYIPQVFMAIGVTLLLSEVFLELCSFFARIK